jgi:hypothetical protein
MFSTPSSTQVNLAWTASTDNVGVAGYQIFRSGIQIGTTGNVFYTDWTATPGASYTYMVKAYDAANNVSGPSNTVNVTVPLLAAPVITSSLTATGAQNSAFTYQITATSSPTSYGASGLPSGLSVNTATGLISGTPATSGTFNVTLAATNSGGTGTAILAVTINPAAPPPSPVITSSMTATGTVNTALSYQITATNSPMSFGASGLPSGLSVDTTTGLISGTAATSGTFNVTLSATNSGGTGTAILVLTVNPAPPPPPADFSISASPSSASIKSGTPATYTVTVTGLNGFNGQVNFSVTGGAGSFSPTTVTGSGSTIMSVSAPKGSYTLTVTATGGGLIHSTSVSLRVHN